MYKFCLIAIAVLLSITLVSSFQQPSTSSTILKRHGSHTIIRQSCHYKSPVTLYQSTQEDTISQQEEDDEEEYELVEFFVSPKQIEDYRLDSVRHHT